MRYTFLLCLVVFLVCGRSLPASERPNILWLTAEDIGPQLGCYGDRYARTPHLDQFATRSILYLNAWSNAPVCAPARTTIISGMYPCSTGSEHMRSLTRLPDRFHMYPVYLRQAGYFCVNPGKEDYNLAKIGRVWDKVSKQNPWPELKEHQPFMAVLNHTGTHESQLRKRPHVWQHDPVQAPIPAYHPDIPEAHEDWAQYYDNITDMDAWFGQQLQRLKDQGLAENTIVFFYGDHGSGMPRDKRWLYNSGLRVPFLIHVPERFRDLIPQDVPAQGDCRQLVSFVDLAPTVISLAGQKPPEHLQGNAFLGSYAAAPQQHAYGFRGRMDERIDFSRTVRNERYHYIRNYLPHRIQGEYLDYMFQTPTTRRWRELFLAGKLNEAQSRFWQPKPAEELYDLARDPEEIHNLVDSAEHADILKKLRQAHVDHVLRIRDVGFLPEAELHRRPELAPYELGRDPELYPLQEILRMADAASEVVPDAPTILAQGLKHADGTVRYWAVTGLLIHGKPAVMTHHEQLRTMLRTDSSASVQIAAAEALGRYGDDSDLSSAVDCLIGLADSEKYGPYHALAALNAVDHLKEKAPSIVARVRQLPLPDEFSSIRNENYPRRMADAIIAESK